MALDLLVASGVLLYLELVLIRWASACVFITAYYSNLILIGCFFGFGLGCILSKKKDIFRYVLIFLSLVLLLCRFWNGTNIASPIAGDYTFSSTLPTHNLLVLPLLYLLVTCVFMAIGQKLATLMNGFPPLEGYGINITGSLLGTLAFAVISFLQLSPTVWFVGGVVLLLWLLRRETRWLGVSLVLAICCVGLVQQQQKYALWSPYYKIQIEPALPVESGSFRILVNNDYHQFALNLSSEWAQKDPGLQHWKQIYDLPYLVFKKPPARVLVLGAGSGNDVAAALRYGAQRVDAVELDPLIATLGREGHPEHPYADPRVHVYVTDARAFLQHPPAQYDMVIMGWLDSHRLFSSLSSVRQDTFLYTVDAMRRIRYCLKDQGVFCLSFYVARPWIAAKLHAIVTAAFGDAPHVYAYTAGGYGEPGHQLIIQNNHPVAVAPSFAGFKNLDAMYATLKPVDMPTDDWPYLYYKNRSLSKDYLQMMGVLLLISLVGLAIVVPREKKKGSDALIFFFLGAGFFLLEVTNVTRFALLFGATWIVTAVVISAILCMVLASLWLMEKGYAPSERWTWVCLFASALLAWFWNDTGLSPSLFNSQIPTALILSLTFFFANIIFIRRFASVKTPGTMLGYNILGSVVGGFTEYGTLVIGIKAMYGIVILCYAMAWMSSVRLLRGSETR